MAISLNGTTYNGGANPYPPTKIAKKRTKVGKTLVMASGVRVFVYGGNNKSGWVLTWENANEVTRAAVAAVTVLTTTFAFVDQLGVTRTVQCEADEQVEDTAFTTAANAILYDVQLTIWQAD